MHRFSWLVFLVASSLDAAVSGNAQIRAKAGPSEIVITTTSRLAGAIHSLTWNGREFIDSADHGRQLQSASNFDAGSRILSETYNPTEAGSRFAGAGKNSTRVLHALIAQDNELSTLSQMAFWLRPGEKSGGQPAKNRTVLSGHQLQKIVTIGVHGLSHAIGYQVKFVVPPGEVHHHAVFEAVTGYMPPAFSEFWTFDPATRKLVKLSDGPGEQRYPVIFSTPDRQYAMGVWSPAQPSKGFNNVGYGRFRFKPEKVVKWNCVFRIRQLKPIRTGDHVFKCYVIVGSLKNVTSTMDQLRRRFGRARK